MTLSSRPVGERVRITEIRLDDEQVMGLFCMGLRRGVEISLLQRTAGGGWVIACGVTRVALSKYLVDALQVELIAA